MRKNNIYLSQVIIAASVCLFSGWAGEGSAPRGGGKGSDPVPFEYKYEETFPLPASRTIRITSEDADVSVAGSDRDDILIQAHYHISSTREMIKRFNYVLNVDDGGGELRVVEKRRTGTRNFRYDKRIHSIKVEVPRGTNVTIQEEDGSCVISGINGAIRLTLDDGNAELKDCDGDIATTIDNGSLSMTNCTGSVKNQLR